MKKMKKFKKFNNYKLTYFKLMRNNTNKFNQKIKYVKI